MHSRRTKYSVYIPVTFEIRLSAAASIPMHKAHNIYGNYYLLRCIKRGLCLCAPIASVMTNKWDVGKCPRVYALKMKKILINYIKL